LPCLPNSAEEVRILLYRSEERTLQRSGIDFESLRYQSPALARLRSSPPDRTKVRIKYDPADLSALYVFDPTGSGRWLRVPAVDEEYTRELSLWKHRVIRSYILRQKQEVDIYALAAAKQHIQEIVASEFARTRKSRGRKTAARFLAQESTPPPSPALPDAPSATVHSGQVIAALSPSVPQEQEVTTPQRGLDPSHTNQRAAQSSKTSKTPPQPDRSQRKSHSPQIPTTPSTSGEESEPLDTTGWGGDYSLPQHAARP